jgi:transposase-like protein
MTRRIGSKDYPEEIKRRAIQLYTEEGLPACEIKDRLGIYDQKRISVWLRQYKQEGEAMFANKRRLSGRKPNHESPASYTRRLEIENEILKKVQSELREHMLVKRNIGPFTTSKENTL